MGTPIKASSYCVDYEYFKQIAGLVMSIQWFRKYQPLTDEIFEVMYNETSGIIERIISIWENIQLDYIFLPEEAKTTFRLTTDMIRACSTKTNPLLGMYAKQTIREDLLSSAEMEGKGSDDEMKTKRRVDKSITEFRISDNPLLVQEVFTRVKNNLLEAGEAFPDEYILENANRVIKLKSNKEKTDDELIELTIKRVRKNRKRLIDTKAIEHNNDVRMGRIDTIDLNSFHGA